MTPFEIKVRVMKLRKQAEQLRRNAGSLAEESDIRPPHWIESKAKALAYELNRLENDLILEKDEKLAKPISA